MAKSVLNSDRFHNEEAAFAYVEAELWPNGPACPHCGNAEAKRIGRLQGKTTRAGLHKCYGCRKPFTVRIGTIFEDSHLPLRLWLQAIHLMCASKKGLSTRQLQRMLGCGMKTAWHLGMRIRAAMAPAANAGPLGGSGKTVEADETELSKSRKTKKPAGHRRGDNPVVLSLIERGGNIRSVTLDHHGVSKHLRQMVHKDSRLVTDKAPHYKLPPVAVHESVDHSKFEWTRGDVHTNTLEGFFSVIKRGLVGVYQHVDTKHLDKYLSEFDFRQNTRSRLGVNDVQREAIALQGAKGKRLYYRQPA
jgi:transposase-like protein